MHEASVSLYCDVSACSASVDIPSDDYEKREQKNERGRGRVREEEKAESIGRTSS